MYECFTTLVFHLGVQTAAYIQWLHSLHDSRIVLYVLMRKIENDQKTDFLKNGIKT